MKMWGYVDNGSFNGMAKEVMEERADFFFSAGQFYERSKAWCLGVTSIS